MVHLRLPAGLLHHAARLRLPTVAGGAGKYHLGLLLLLPDHHCRRTYLEGDGAGLPATDDRRYRHGLQGKIPMGTDRHVDLRGLRGQCQPRADDLLLPLPHPLHHHRLPRRGHPSAAGGALAQGFGRLRRGRHPGHLHQPLQPLPHVGVSEGEYAWQERAGEEEHGHPDELGSRPRLYHAVELWHRRDDDAPRARRQGWRECAAEPEQHGHEACRQQRGADAPDDLRQHAAIFRHAARHVGPSLCGRFRAVPLHPRPFHRQRPDEMGTFGGYDLLHPPLVG